MSALFEPIGYVAGVACIASGYIPIVSFYEPGKPSETVWVGAEGPSVSEAMMLAEAHRIGITKPRPEDVLAALRRVLEAIDHAGNLMAITHHDNVQAARTIVAKLGGLVVKSGGAL